MQKIKITLITLLVASLTCVSFARPHGPRFHHHRHPHHHHPHHSSVWGPLAVAGGIVAAATIANTVTQPKEIVVTQPSTTTVYTQVPQYTKKREVIQPDGTRIIYYE